MIKPRIFWLVASPALCAVAAFAQTYYFTGPSGVSFNFYNESYWTENADGSGASPDGELLITFDKDIDLDLIIDGDEVDAVFGAQFGSGSLTLESGSVFNVSSPFADFHIKPDATFSSVNSTLAVGQVIQFEGDVSMEGGSVTSETNQIRFQKDVQFSIDGTAFSSDDAITFYGEGVAKNATFQSGGDIRMANDVKVIVVDTNIEIRDGGGLIRDMDGSDSSLILTGNSVLTANGIQSFPQTSGSVNLILRDQSIANFGFAIFDANSTVTLASTDASLVINKISILNNLKENVINGATGLSYAEDDSTWNIQGWNGADGVTLKIESTNLLCDFDNDNQCTSADIDLLYVNFGSVDPKYDLDQDSTVDGGDIAAWLTSASDPLNAHLGGKKTFKLGDVNLDGSVDSADLGLLLNNFDSDLDLSFGAGNMNGDESVDSTDLGLLLNSFGHESTDATAVPEPTTKALMLLALLRWAAAMRRNRVTA